MTGQIPLAIPYLSGNESRYVQQALDEGMVSSVGRHVREFEERFADYLGVNHAVACSSGTAALHLAMVALGIAEGQAVYCSDFTFIASANAALYQGANITLIDSDPESWNMSSGLLGDAMAQSVPSAIELVHVLGMPADPSIIASARDLGIPVVEDAAEALGAEYLVGGRWRKVGSVGTVGAFSFNGNKLLTTGGGGMLATDDPDLATLMRHLSTQAKVPGVGYLHDRVGYNYRMTNLAAALGLAQLERIDHILDRKRQIAEMYDAAFQGVAELMPVPYWSRPTSWLYSVCVGPEQGGPSTRDHLLRSLIARGIEARPLWRPLHLQPPLVGYPRVGGDVAEDLASRGISLPCSPQLTDAEQLKVVENVLASLR